MFMSTGVYFAIKFENNSEIFNAGQTVCGIVRMTLGEQKTVRKLYLRLSGVASTTFSDSRTRYVSKEIYLNHALYLAGGPSAAGK